MNKFFLLLILCFPLFINCSSDSSPEDEMIEGDDEVVVVTDDVITTDDGPADDNIVLPQIAIVGNTFEQSSDLFLIRWNEDYSENTILDIREHLNNNMAAYFSAINGGFTLTDFGDTPISYKYLFETNLFEEFDSSNYLNTQVETPFQKVLPLRDYIVTRIEDLDNNVDDYLNVYNSNTGESTEFYLGTGSFPNSYIMGEDDFAFILYDSDNDDDYDMRVFNLITGQEVSFPYLEGSTLLYNSVSRSLFIAQDGGCISSYDILDLDTLTMTGSDSFLENICAQFSILARNNSFNDKMVVNISPQVMTSSFTTNLLFYNFTTDVREIIPAALINNQIATQTSYPIASISALNVDLETETIIAAFNYGDSSVSDNGALAFLNYELEVLLIVETGSVLVKDVIFE